MYLDIHDYDKVIEFAKKQAANFQKPKNFAGGRFQTTHAFIFIHVDFNGKLRRIEINKPGGSKFYLNPWKHIIGGNSDFEMFL